jgi:predicted ATPase
MSDRKSLRIGIVGAAGTGKTSLAEALSSAFDIPLLKSREITDDILKRDGYDYALGIQIERFLANSGRPNEILRRTIAQQQQAEQFVTDRTVVDLAAYAVCELHDMDVVAVRNIVETCKKNVSSYTHLFLCPWKDVPVENNKRRTLNPWYQFLIHVAELGILQDWRCQYTVLATRDTKDRIGEIGSILGL